ELDGVARWILDEDLTAARPLDDLTAEGRPVGCETLDGRIEIGNDDLETIPASGLRDAAGLARAAHTRLVEKQSQVILRPAAKSRGSPKGDSKAQTTAVEVDCLVDVCHEVPHSRLSHWCSPFRLGASLNNAVVHVGDAVLAFEDPGALKLDLLGIEVVEQAAALAEQDRYDV